MSSIGILPFEHPTTIALVDDDPDFLSSFGLAQTIVSGRLRSFSVPEQVLSAIAAQRDVFANPNRLGGEASVADPERFSALSVLVTDYEMGHHNGGDLCRRIENRAIGRIGVTGKVDERFAVSAFNENLIDRYLRKDDPQLVEKTGQFVTELKREYFSRSATPVSDSTYRAKVGFLFDPEVADFFHQSCQDNGMVEYYLSFDLPGFLMLDADGEPLLSRTRLKITQYMQQFTYQPGGSADFATCAHVQILRQVDAC